ncbi:hypothetical protein OE88DRAFT_1667557 [Heliocybe sulcata]|uniref:Uncharacterized protein n=1 Tax=Heliocybe sulcata TaxID=5364 RepID=A0A5C3MM84_9AGAM|nr:hypothetical protein OE88DRAFT_1667557 [Heliocybe sulcata]
MLIHAVRDILVCTLILELSHEPMRWPWLLLLLAQRTFSSAERTLLETSSMFGSERKLATYLRTRCCTGHVFTSALRPALLIAIGEDSPRRRHRHHIRYRQGFAETSADAARDWPTVQDHLDLLHS